MVHCGPVGDWDLNQLRVDRGVPFRPEGREAPAGVVDGPRDRAGLDADGILAEAMVPLAGHQRSVGDDLDCVSFHFVAFLLVVKPFLT